VRSDRPVFPAVLSIGLLALALPSGEAQTAPNLSTPQGTAARAVTPPAQPAYVPLTGSERLHRYLLGLVSPGAVVRSAAAAGINQWNNTPAEWHQGAEGYGRRFASSYAGHMVRQSLQSGLGAVFDEDNRYVPSTASGFGPRLGYALSSTFIARSHTGARKVSISAAGSLVGSAFISRAWQPPSTSHPSNALTSVVITGGVIAGLHVAREFFPNLMHGWLWH
jgi:hypothetical protein